jgi:hypothetical protein
MIHRAYGRRSAEHAPDAPLSSPPDDDARALQGKLSGCRIGGDGNSAVTEDERVLGLALPIPPMRLFSPAADAPHFRFGHSGN